VLKTGSRRFHEFTNASGSKIKPWNADLPVSTMHVFSNLEITTMTVFFNWTTMIFSVVESVVFTIVESICLIKILMSFYKASQVPREFFFFKTEPPGICIRPWCNATRTKAKAYLQAEYITYSQQ
jgi:hypothetical protein